MNVYLHTFSAECPVNGAVITYSLKLESRDRIMVEQIVERCAVGVCFHEDLADALYEWFGGRQTMTAFHHGVWITTHRGAE